jgi:fatty-acyl-CoA synthase
MPSAEHYVARLLSVFAARPDRVVLWWLDRPITAAELSRSITTAALVLRREGIGEATTVALLTASNSPEMLSARYAANLLGASVLCISTGSRRVLRNDVEIEVPLGGCNPLDGLSVEARADMLAESNTALFIVDSENVAQAREISARMATHPRVATWAAAGRESSSDLVDLSSAPGAEPFDLATVASGGTAMVNYTSGSTGRPKGVARTFASLDGELAYFQRAAKEHTMLVTSPLHGPTCASNVNFVLATGGNVVLHDGFDPAVVLAAIARHRVTRLSLAPPQLYQLVDHPARATTDVSSLQQIIYSACAAAPRRIAQAMEAFGPVLTQVYGSSEAAGISILGPSEHGTPKLLTTAGRPLPIVEVAIRDPQGADLSVGQAGEICVRSPFMMSSYWRDPEATARALRAGWLHTGDVGYLDDEGYLHLVDRLAGGIKTPGMMVYPASIEEVLLAHPTVTQAAAFKVVDADEVEHVYAAVVPHHGGTVDVAELRFLVEHKLSMQHAPAEIIVLDALPLLGTGKPNKRLLSFEAEIAAGWRLPPESVSDVLQGRPPDHSLRPR